MLLKLLFFSTNEELGINRNIVLNYLSKQFIIENDKLFLNNISFNFKLFERENSVSLFLSSNNRDTFKEAKVFDSVRNTIISGKERKDFGIVTLWNEASNLFNSKLNKLISEFENRLRQVMYITLINAYGREWIIKSFSKEQIDYLKNKNTNVLVLLDNAFEFLTFYDYIEFLFSEYTILTPEAAIEDTLLKIENNNLDILTIKNILSSSKKKTSLWNKLFEKKFDIFNKQILEDIRSIRNKVMHNKNINFDDYSVNLNLLNKINKEIKKVINVLETQDILKDKPVKDVISSFNQILIKNNNFYTQLLDINNKILDHSKMLQTTYQNIALKFNPANQILIKNNNFYTQLLDINNKILDHSKMLQTTYQNIALKFNPANQILIKNNNLYHQLLGTSNKILDHSKMLQTTYQDIALSFNPMLKMIGNFYKQEGMIKVFNNIGYYQTLMLNSSIGSNRFKFPTSNLY